MFAKLETVDTKSLMKKYVTKEVLEKYIKTETPKGRILADLIKSGVECPHSHVGIYLCDPDVYESDFRELFEKVISEYHKVPKVAHPAFSFHDPNISKDSEKFVDFPDLDPEGKMIISSRARTARNLLGHSLPPIADLEERMTIFNKAKDALCSLEGELKGTFFPLENMSEEDQTKLRQEHFLFRNDNPYVSENIVFICYRFDIVNCLGWCWLPPSKSSSITCRFILVLFSSWRL